MLFEGNHLKTWYAIELTVVAGQDGASMFHRGCSNDQIVGTDQGASLPERSVDRCVNARRFCSELESREQLQKSLDNRKPPVPSTFGVREMNAEEQL